MSTKKTNIIIRRYHEQELPKEAFCENGEFPWEASVEPDDASWVMFVPKPGSGAQPQLWVAVGDVDNGDGTGERAYALAGSEEHKAFLKEAGLDKETALPVR